MRFPSILGLALLMGGAADPRPELVELHLSGRFDQALQQTQHVLEVDPEQAREWGLDYLQGHLQERLQAAKESPISFADAMTSTPPLASHARYRLAIDRYRSGQPEAAAGLLATLLANSPPPSLVPTAVRWLTVALHEGGDCQLLNRWRDWPLEAAQVRQLQAVIIDCTLEAEETEEALDLMRSLLNENQTDETARRAALGLATLSPAAIDPRTTLLIGLTFFQNREFERAIPFLVASLEDSEAATRDVRKVDRADILFSLARSHYWQGQFASAIQTFTQAAMEETESDKTARALFHRGRSHALQGDWDAAVASFAEAAAAAPRDSWAAAALISGMRLEWRQGREESALASFQQLRSRRSWRSTLERASLFLAVSDLIGGRADRAGDWLDVARQARRRDGPEIWYWRGRLAELQKQPDIAVRRYLDLLTSDPLHPLSGAARRRLAQPELQQAAEVRGAELSASNRTTDLLQAWLLLARDSPAAVQIQQDLQDRWRRSPTTRPYLEMAARDPQQWALWRQPVRQPEEILLNLGIAETMSPAVRRAFPLAETDLALAGSRLLSASGLHQRSLYMAEVVSRRLPSSLPDQFLPGPYRRLLYPRPYEFHIEQQASRFGVDPDLLTAIIREESRFDPMAVSGASARGLSQFVWSTARRLARKLDWRQIAPSDLHTPEVAITLGAAYLAELSNRFDGRTVQAVAAYNAGEDLARLWQAYCFSQEPEEYFSKVGFRQTRGYLEKVLESRAHYAEIYSQQSRP
jgi:soluble lytic murein transglycosylase